MYDIFFLICTLFFTDASDRINCEEKGDKSRDSISYDGSRPINLAIRKNLTENLFISQLSNYEQFYSNNFEYSESIIKEPNMPQQEKMNNEKTKNDQKITIGSEQDNNLLFNSFLEINIDYVFEIELRNKCIESLEALVGYDLVFNNLIEAENLQVYTGLFVNNLRSAVIDLFFERRKYSIFISPDSHKNPYQIRNRFKPLCVFLPETIVILIRFIKEFDIERFNQIKIDENIEINFALLNNIKRSFYHKLKRFLSSYKHLLYDFLKKNNQISYDQKRCPLTYQCLEKYFTSDNDKHISRIQDFYYFFTSLFISVTHTGFYGKNLEMIFFENKKKEIAIRKFDNFLNFIVNENVLREEDSYFHSFSEDFTRIFRHSRFSYIFITLGKFYESINYYLPLKGIIYQNPNVEIKLVPDDCRLYVEKKLNGHNFGYTFKYIDFVYYKLDILISSILSNRVS